mmetsp:Transcript_7113/g.23314  ORF Transcript_7113/g.23314 Transcript_7113/m.23314 type:complete len:222 (+) Transcript_7113:99-764(+)
MSGAARAGSAPARGARPQSFRSARVHRRPLLSAPASLLAHQAHARLHARFGVLALRNRAQVGSLVLAQLSVGPVCVVDLGEATLGAVDHGARHVRVCQVGAGQVRACEVRHLEVRLDHVGVLEVGVGEVGVEERGRAQVGALKVCRSNDALLERNTLQIFPFPDCVIQVHSTGNRDASASLQCASAAALDLRVLRLLCPFAYARLELLVLADFGALVGTTL